MEVKVKRSVKRKRTVSARLEGQTMLVNAPALMPEEKLRAIIENFKKRFEKRALKKELNRQVNLIQLCRKFSAEYFNYNIEVESIAYSPDQTCKWGVCNYRNRTILISHRLAEMPDWVRDYVIIHEMAHIRHHNHSQRFWKLVQRYELAERARGYLMAKGYEDTNETDIEH